MTQHVLDPASDAEAEMAAVANACLMTALDHSRAEHIKITLEFDDGKGEPPVLHLPPRALRFFTEVLRQMAKREPMVLMPQKAELTTQEAAAFLNVSRPFVIKEIEAQRLGCRMVNKHRRIEFEELVRYQAQEKENAANALRDVSRFTREIGQEL
ncbi:helix-turn-helix domain-containing protein [Polaromonas sp.]|uniref:helix-turn-helix domain-containing protein n=1 Tax=Polaromonas sp. TaxID=1869339 RepID=UPI003264ADF7